MVVNGAAIVVGDQMQTVRNGYIVIEDGCIVDVGSELPFAPGEHVDARGTIAIPALVNAHTHVGDAAGKEAAAGLPIGEAVMPPNSAKDRVLSQTRKRDRIEAVRESCKHMIATGCLTFADFCDGGTEGIEALAKAVADLEITFIPVGRFSTPTPFSAKQLARNTGRLPEDWMHELLGVLDRADAFSCGATLNGFTDPALMQIREAVKSKGKALIVHCSEAADIRERSLRQTGKTDVRRALEILRADALVHLVHATDEDLDEVAARQVPVVACPRSSAVLGVGIYGLRRFLERGITVALGTDNVMLNSVNMFREMEFASKVTCGLECDPAYLRPEEVLKMATINGAKALGLDKVTGSILAGKTADIVFINTTTLNTKWVRNPVAGCVRRVESSDIRAVMRKGMLVSGTPFPAPKRLYRLEGEMYVEGAEGNERHEGPNPTSASRRRFPLVFGR